MNDKQESKMLSNFDMFANEILFDTQHIGFIEALVHLYFRETKNNDYEYTELVEWLAKPYKEPIKVSKLWYEMMDYMYDMDGDYSQYTGKVNDYSFINAFIDFVPKEYRDIPLKEYLERLEVE